MKREGTGRKRVSVETFEPGPLRQSEEAALELPTGAIIRLLLLLGATTLFTGGHRKLSAL